MHFVVPPDHPCLHGHFPGRPVVPGVVLVERVLEAIQQAGHDDVDGWRLRQAKFVQSLLPGQHARIELQQPETATARWRFRVWRDDDGDATLLASGEVAPA